MTFLDTNPFLENFKCSSFEFALSNQTPLIDRILSYQSDFSNISQEVRSKTILSYLHHIFPFYSQKIDKIFFLFPDLLFHIGIDSRYKRVKLYLSLYDIPFTKSVIIITTIRKIFSIQDSYKLEKNFIHFDCIGIDFTDTSIDLKIYEIILDKYPYEGIPEFIQPSEVREVGYLKSVSGRKKKFFRFSRKLSILLFTPYFDTSGISMLQEKIKDFYTLEKLVKYFCVEGDKREIYFI